MLKILFLFIMQCWTLSSYANSDLKIGDVLLQPLDCYACNLIEAEEQTIYSHIGLVISTDPLLVTDSRTKVGIQTFDSFNLITEKSQKIRVIRLKDENLVSLLQTRSSEFFNFFKEKFEGLPYDHEFLWDNVTDKGSEMLYCSEMITKLLQAFLGIEPIVKRMHFERNREQWEQYFQGKVPDGKWGNSPGDFERSEIFYVVGDL